MDKNGQKIEKKIRREVDMETKENNTRLKKTGQTKKGEG
jgi:hypothetical protein